MTQQSTIDPGIRKNDCRFDVWSVLKVLACYWAEIGTTKAPLLHIKCMGLELQNLHQNGYSCSNNDHVKLK